MIQSKLIYTQIGKKTWSGKWVVAFVGEGPERLPHSTVRRAGDAKRTIHKKNLIWAWLEWRFCFLFVLSVLKTACPAEQPKSAIPTPKRRPSLPKGVRFGRSELILHWFVCISHVAL